MKVNKRALIDSQAMAWPCGSQVVDAHSPQQHRNERGMVFLKENIEASLSELTSAALVRVDRQINRRL
jgi:hypothetical protein